MLIICRNAFRDKQFFQDLFRVESTTYGDVKSADKKNKTKKQPLSGKPILLIVYVCFCISHKEKKRNKVIDDDFIGSIER